MSDPVPVRISELPALTTLNVSDLFAAVQAGATSQFSFDSLAEQTSAENSDEYLVIRANQFYRIAATNFPVRQFLGSLSFIPGNVQNPSQAFPALCLTNFDGATVINATNWPDLTPWLRGQQVIYLEGQIGEVTQFPGTVAGSVITLDDTTANNNLLAALDEDRIALGGTFTTWRTIDIDGTTYDITALNVTTREITVSGSPTTGTQNAIFYPHRISTSTTTARVHSWRGRSPIGAGTSELVSGFFRRDRLQGHRHFVTNGSNIESSLINYGNTVGAGGANIARSNIASGTQLEIRDPNADGINGTPRTGATTHGPDVGVHIYQYGGRYIP